MHGILETLQLRKKLSLIENAYDHKEGEDELRETKKRIEETLKVAFTGDTVINLDPLFFPSGAPSLSDSFCTQEQARISGHAIGSLGTLLFCHYNDTPVYLPLKKYVGYHVDLSFDQTDLQLPARQASLF
jgi:hypothetical protein